METWKILIITVVGAIAAGVAAGIFIGKILVKRAKSGRKRLLSTKERVVYSACILLGAALILFGVFFKFPSTGAASPDDMMIIDGGMAADEKLRDSAKAAAGTADATDAGDADNAGDETDAAQDDVPEGEVAEDGGIAVAAAA